MPVERLTPSALPWFKSSYSGANTTECLETAFVRRGVFIRDSKRADGPRLLVSSTAWARFVADAAGRP
ncbi:DUF397 domain-containing protein [Streptomyces sp. NPDC004732]|uniref:DUF397 domain-containing protein n=1 Tax=Streptomyces sp. NPDC004732 TaxID=3154290 RepID=UPI0033AF1308